MTRLLVVVATAVIAAGCSKSNGAGSAGGTSSRTTAGSATTSTGGSGSSGGSSAGSNGSSGSNCPGNLGALTLSPSSSSVTLTGGTAAPITFTVRDSAGQPLPAGLFTWTANRADDTDPGTIVAGVYQPNPMAGGEVTISATGCGQSTSTTITFSVVFLGSAVTDGGRAVASGDFSGAFTPAYPDGGAASGSPAPKIIYPSDQTRFPRNVYKVLFQWSRQGNAIFRLVFTGAHSTVTLFTDGSDPACAAVASTVGCWQADSATWTAIAGSNAGGTVALEVDGAAAPGAAIFGSAQETLGFSRRDIPGAIFYWAADVGGIQRATVSDAEPENYLVGPQKVPPTPLPNGDTVSCVACHSVSRDGKAMAVSGSASGSTAVPKGVWTFKVTPAPPPLPIQLHYGSASGDAYSSFSPDDLRLIYSPRNGGPMLVLDVDSGAVVAPVTVGGTAVAGTAPDWSPRTDLAEFAYADGRGNISSLEWDGATFTTPRILAPPIAGHANAYPRYAAEGDWVAFSSNNQSLFVVPTAPGGGGPLELTAANVVVNNAIATPSENSMPTWAPDGDLRWVAFNSQRPYGAVTTGGNNQIWVTAIDLGRLDGGARDPSYPAFRLPFQALTAKNHRAFWVQDVRFPPDAGPPIDAGTHVPPDAGPCVATGATCDPTGAACCDQATTGASCTSLDGGAASTCQVPVFR